MTTTVRANILGFVSRYPAAHVREIERQLGLSSKLASYHLAALEAAGLVRRVEADGYVRWVEARTDAQLGDRDLRLLCHLRRPPAFRIAGELLQVDELPQNQIARALGLAKASVSYHLKALLVDGIVVVRSVGRERLYRLARPEHVRRVMLEFGPIPGELDSFSAMLSGLLRGSGRNGRNG